MGDRSSARSGTPWKATRSNERSSIMARGLFATWNFTTHRGIMLLAVIASGIGTWSHTARAQSQGLIVTTSDTLGANARQAMLDIFRKKDATAVDRFFA